MVVDLKIVIKDCEGERLVRESVEYEAFCLDLLDPLVKDRLESAIADFKGNKEDFTYDISSKLLIDKPPKKRTDKTIRFERYKNLSER